MFYLWRGCLPEQRFTFPESLTRPLATAIWFWRSRGGCSDRIAYPDAKLVMKPEMPWWTVRWINPLKRAKPRAPGDSQARPSRLSAWLSFLGKRPVLAVCTSQQVSETIALKTRVVLQADGGRFLDPESRREAAATKHREEAQDCRADDAAWCIGSPGSATAWGQSQPGVLLAQPLSPRPSGRIEELLPWHIAASLPPAIEPAA